MKTTRDYYTAAMLASEDGATIADILAVLQLAQAALEDAATELAYVRENVRVYVATHDAVCGERLRAWVAQEEVQP